MRRFWTAVLVTGLVLVGIDTYQRRVATAEPGILVASEDGTPMPYPWPTPSPRPKTR